jgi:hypothetical protein
MVKVNDFIAVEVLVHHEAFHDFFCDVNKREFLILNLGPNLAVRRVEKVLELDISFLRRF